MIKKVLLIAACGIMFCACEKKTESVVKDVAGDSLAVNESNINVEAIPENCYMTTKLRDTVFLKMENNLGTITGKMYYKNFQKDSSFGDIVGMEDGDTLKVDYTFQSEGTTSTREIWFLKKDGKLIEGIGDLNETGEQYADIKKLKFEGGYTLSTADCAKISKTLNSVPKAPVSVSADGKEIPEETNKK